MENINILRKIAWSFQKTTGLEFNELISEAYIGYHQASEKYPYQPEKGKPSTYIWYHVSQHLMNYTRKTKKYYEHSVFYTKDDLDYYHSNSYIEIEEKRPHQDMIDMIINLISVDSLVANNSPNTAKNILTRMLQDKGYSQTEIWKMFRILKKEL